MTSKNTTKRIFLAAGVVAVNILISATATGSVADTSSLPLFVIDTRGNIILDEPKTDAFLKIIFHGLGKINSSDDPGNVYEGNIGIEYRGRYSQTFPQKPYLFETRNAAGEKLNVPLLGFPPEHEWILIPSYNDKTFLRNDLTFRIFRQMGHYAPRSTLCEVILNGDYQGIYLFCEKIKVDRNRVSIAKLDTDDNSGDSLTGGYIFKQDYYDESNSWMSLYPALDRPGSSVYFVYEYPGPEKITWQQKQYLRSFVFTFEKALYGDAFTDPFMGYRPYTDVGSFIDYFIVGELSRNIDAYKKSCYYYKDRDSRDGRLHAGPVWDFDWAWKNIDECDIFRATDGSGWAWQVNSCGNWPVAVTWMERLLQDKHFADELHTRYMNLRKTILSEDSIFGYIDSVSARIDYAQNRHYARWPILGINVGTPEVDPQPDSYEGVIDQFRDWISKRLAWLDQNMPGAYLEYPGDSLPIDRPVRLYPNPASDRLFVIVSRPAISMRIFSITGTLCTAIFEPFGENGYQATVSHLPPGLYVVRIVTNNGAVVTGKFAKE
ncbi:MAG: CotH kinase family protein [Bacteroidales bacterium]